MPATKANERTGNRAQAKHVRSSASKAREVLNAIRNKPCIAAQDILAFSERGISTDIAKVLNSAIANASHEDRLDAEELYVAQCYADEGATLKRSRPRARGRATPIFKRTCHITVVVDAIDDEFLASGDGASRTGSQAAAQQRRQRVESSRQSESSDDTTANNENDTEVDNDNDTTVDSATDTTLESATDTAVDNTSDTEVDGASDTETKSENDTEAKKEGEV